MTHNYEAVFTQTEVAAMLVKRATEKLDLGTLFNYLDATIKLDQFGKWSVYLSVFEELPA